MQDDPQEIEAGSDGSIIPPDAKAKRSKIGSRDGSRSDRSGGGSLKAARRWPGYLSGCAMAIPTLHHMQIMTLAILADRARPVPEIADILRSATRERNYSSAYVTTLLLRRKRLAEGWGFTEAYRITDKGRNVLRDAENFYREICSPLERVPRVVPGISHLQATILFHLRDGEKPGADVREFLTSLGRKTTDAAFYLVMARLERKGFAEGRFELHAPERSLGGRWRCYSVTQKGREALKDVRDFYSAVLNTDLASTVNK